MKDYLFGVFPLIICVILAEPAPTPNDKPGSPSRPGDSDPPMGAQVSLDWSHVYKKRGPNVKIPMSANKFRSNVKIPASAKKFDPNVKDLASANKFGPNVKILLRENKSGRM